MDIVILDAMGEDYLMISVPVEKAPLKVEIIDDLCAGRSTFNCRNDR
jgi:hypothetical protein